MSRRAWVLFVVLGVLWGLPYFFIRIVVRAHVDPGTLVFLRTGIAALVLLPIALYRRRLRELVVHWRWIVVYSVGEMAIPWLLLSSAEQKVTSSFAGLMVAVVPLLGAAFARALGAERLGHRRFSGLVVGFAGVIVLAGVDVRGTDIVALLELAGCAVGYAAAPIVVSRRLNAAPSFEVVTASVVLTALAYLPYGITHLPRQVSSGTVASLGVLSVVCTAVVFMVFFALIHEVGPARAVVVTYVNPAVALLLGVFALGEPFTVGIAIGFPLILIGSVLATWTARPGAPPLSEGQAPPLLVGEEEVSADAELSLAPGLLGDKLD